ncbi:MAG: glycosyltransferase family protein [Rhodocyclales bacterium]|nr:glycosyltransferase family protein [Rhodocyclales bacterium]
MLSRQLERLRRCRKVDKLLVATSDDPSDQPIAELCAAEAVACFRGSLNDVLDRYYQAAKLFQPSHVVRLTGDCPLADPELIDRTIEFHLQGGYDFVSNAIEPTFPDGLDAAVFRFQLLEQAWRAAQLPSEREHLTLFMRHHPERYKIGNYKGSPDRSYMRWTVDEPADLAFVSAIYQRLYPGKPDFGSEDIYRLLDQEAELPWLNRGIGRNEGLQRSLQQDNEWKAKNEKPNS